MGESGTHDRTAASRAGGRMCGEEATMNEPAGEHEDTDAAEDTDPAEDTATDLLVEEVSIDGLCGVY